MSQLTADTGRHVLLCPVSEYGIIVLTQQDHDNWTHTTGYVTHNVNTARP